MDTNTKITELEERIKLLEEANNVNSLKYWREKLIGKPFGDNDSAVTDTANISVNILTGLGTLDVLDFPDGYIEQTKPNGEKVRIPYYNLSRF